MTAFALGAAWLTGTCLALALPPANAAGVPFLLPAALALLAAVVSWQHPLCRLAAVSVAMAALGFWRGEMVLVGQHNDPLFPYLGGARLVGVVDTAPVLEGEEVSFVLAVEAVQGTAGWVETSGRVQVRARWGLPVQYGDRLEASGTLRRPVNRAGYPSADLLARQGVYEVMEYPRLTLLDPAGPRLPLVIENIRSGLISALGRVLPEPHASLLGGLLLGWRASFAPELKRELIASGTSHIVAVSGFNVAVVTGALQVIFLRLVGRRRLALPALAGITVYTVLTGAPASAVRAAIMGGAAVVASSVGRIADPLTSVVLAAAAMAAWSPLVVLDIGYQLSFLATAGLVLMEPVLRDWLRPVPGWARGVISVSLAAQIATIPLSLFYFRSVSLVALVSNLLVAPAVPAAMALGLPAMLGSLLGPLGPALSWPAWLALSYMLAIIRTAASVPGALLFTGSLPVVVLLIVYAAFFGWLLSAAGGLGPARAIEWLRSHLQATRAGAVATILALTVVTIAMANQTDGRLHVYFMDVGAGEAVLVRSPSGRLVLVDGGGAGQTLARQLGSRFALWERGVDLVVLASLEESRTAGLAEAFSRYGVAEVLQPAGNGGASARQWADLLRQRGVQPVLAEVGQKVLLGDGVELEVVEAAAVPVRGGPVETQLGLSLSYGSIRVLLPTAASRPDDWSGRRGLVTVVRGQDFEWVARGFSGEAGPVIAILPARTAGPGPAMANAPLAQDTYEIRLHGTVELVADGESYDIRTERCPREDRIACGQT